MILALVDFYAVSVDFVDKAVLLVNLAAPPAGKISFQRFGMAKPRVSVAFDVGKKP